MSSQTMRLQLKNFYLTYLDPSQKIVGPGILLDQLISQLEKFMPYYGIACKESAPSTGTVHYHVLICCKEKCRTRNAEILEIEGIHPHIEKVQNNLRRIIEYIKKNGDIAEYNKDACPVKDGTLSKREKNRTLAEGDLEEEYFKGNIGPIDVIRAVKVRSIFKMNRKPEPYKKKLILWFKGATGEHKTRTAVEIAGRYFDNDYWMSNDTLKWFDGYHGQRVAIIDDFRKSMLTDWSYLLRLLDGYSLCVQIKGGFEIWKPEVIIITSPGSPEEAFQWINKNGETEEWDKQEQLTRRLVYEDTEQVYDFPLWEEDRRRLMATVEDFLGINHEQEMVEEDLELSPILPEPSQIDEA